MAAPTTTRLLALGDDHTLDLGPFYLTRVALEVRGTPTFSEWQKCGASLRWIDGAVRFWIGDWVNYGEERPEWGEKYTQALGSTQLPKATLEAYAFTARNLKALRRRKTLGFSVQSEIARLDPKHQDAWLDRAESEQLTVAELRTALRLQRRRAHYAAGTLPPGGPFRIVYADPPWQYDDAGVIVSSDAYGRAERHYPTMPIDDLAALPVVDHVEDDAVLFLWVTSPMLSACWPVISAWGFDYKTSIVWDKRAHNFGHYVSVRHELLLICTRGSCTPDQPTPMPESVVVERRTDTHSEKPARFRDVIDQLYPLGSALELFSRWTPPDGSRWVVYGNQLLPDAASSVTRSPDDVSALLPDETGPHTPRVGDSVR